MNPQQLYTHVIMPALVALGHRYATDQAAQLLLATAAQESHCGEYIHQIGGPALGIYQMEPATHDDLWLNYISYRPAVMAEGQALDARLIYDLRYATQCARLQYYRFPDPLPAVNDVGGMWSLYKKRWNTPLGAATREQFVSNWARYVDAAQAA